MAQIDLEKYRKRQKDIQNIIHNKDKIVKEQMDKQNITDINQVSDVVYKEHKGVFGSTVSVGNDSKGGNNG